MINGNKARLAVRIALAVLGTTAAAGIAQAQSTVVTSGSTTPDSALTWNGITLYGILDVGVMYQTHGAPVSDYHPAGLSSVVQKFSEQSVTAMTPSNLSQTRIGLSGNEPLPVLGDWAAVFRVETYFNPESGNLSDALKSMTVNNGKALGNYTTGVDSSIAGQLFGVSYLGFSSPTYGTVTFGRQTTPLADGISKYDPAGASQAFSLIGFSGTTAGGGDTEDRRLDQTIKYNAKYNWLHLGALYQFSGSNGSKDTAEQADVGVDFAGFSADAYYAKKYDAVSASALSAAQVGELPGLCTPKVTVPPTAPQCYSTYNSLSGTISDNTTYGIMALYKFQPIPLTLYAGYTYNQFQNPTNPLTAGTIIIGGYQLAFVNNAAYDNEKILDVFWAGAKYGLTPSLDLTVAYYGYHQSAYSTEAALVGCSTQKSAACSGVENSASIYLDWRLSKRFDAYVGTFWSEARNGLANGYLLTSDNLTSSAATISTTMGLRFKF